ncbi:MAG: RodZ domain-containing protein [Chloroflexota bacterium]
MDPTALGRYLRESREAKEITLEYAVSALRIRRDIIEAFEQGNFTVLDSAVRTRGMLRNYAHFLGLEEERVLQYYEAALTDKRRTGRFDRLRTTETIPIAPRKITDTPPSLPVVNVQERSSAGIGTLLRNIAMLLVSLAALAVIAFVVMDTLDLRDDDSADTVADAPTLPAGSVTVTPTNTATVTPRATIITDTPDAAALGIGVGVQVVMEVTQRSWIRVTVDDVEQFAGFFEPGSISTYEANDRVSITAANAAALDITYNGVEQDSFGTRGQEVELTFSTTGIDTNTNPLPTEMTPATEPAQSTPLPTESTTDEASVPASDTVAYSEPTPTPLFSDEQEANIIAASAQSSPTIVANTAQTGQVAPSPTTISEANTSTSDTASAQTTTTATLAPTATVPQASPTNPPTATTFAVLPLRETAVPSPTKSNP